MRTYFGLGSSTFAWGERRTVSIVPLRPFRPEKLMVPSNVEGFLVFSLAFGKTDLLAHSRGIPIELLTEVSTFPQVLWPELGPGVAVTFDLQAPPEPPRPKWWRRFWNWITRKRAPAPPVFSGAFYGVAR